MKAGERGRERAGEVEAGHVEPHDGAADAAGDGRPRFKGKTFPCIRVRVCVICKLGFRVRVRVCVFFYRVRI